MEQVQELFEHELEDIYYAERKLVTALGEMAGESTNPAIRQAFTEHQAQTEGHIRRLDQVFAVLGKKPEAVKCDGIEGLLKEKHSFAKEKPTPQVLDVFNLGAGAKSERYEISAYESLLTMANALGLSAAREPLTQNLQEEEAALTVVKNLAQTAVKQATLASAPR